MARRSDHSREEIRDMALVAAERILTEEGVAGLNARKIASAIGYTVGTLYLVFRNLDDLILQVNARSLDELYATLTRATAACSDPMERLLQLAAAYVAFASSHTHRWELIFQHRLAPGTTLPPWYQTKIHAAFALVETALGELAPQREATDISQAARALWGGVHGICILALTNKLGSPGEADLRSSVDSLVSHYVQGFRASGRQ